MEERTKKGAVVKILMVRFSAIGDCVLAGYLAQSICDSYPNSELHWMVEDRCSEIVELMNIGTVHAVPRTQWRKQGDVKTLIPQYKWLNAMKMLHLDIAIDIQGHSKTAWATRLSGAKKRVSARATDVIARYLNPTYPGPQVGHEIDWNFTVAKSVLPQLHSSNSHPLLKNFAHSPVARKISITTGAGHPKKLIPVMELQRLSSNLTALGYEVTLLGAPNDPSFEQSGVTNLIGKTSLKELVQHVQSSELHIAGDTGSGHIAAAVGTPLLTVWGNMPYERYRPVTMRNSVILNHDSLNETLTSIALEMLGGNLSES